MSQNLLRYLHNGYERIKSEFLNNLAKTPWLNTAALAYSMFRDFDGSIANFYVVGNAFEPVADGSATVTLRSGLALQHDPQGDQYLGDLLPIFSGVDLGVNVTDNSDISGDDRIDLIVVQRTQEDGGLETSKFIDPTTELTYDDDVYKFREWDTVYDVIEGTPASSPAAPATPTGWMPVAEVLRPNGQNGVNPADLTDVRPRTSGTTNNFARFFGFIQLVEDAGIYWGDKDSEFSYLRGDVGQNFRQLSLVTDQQGAFPDGKLNVGYLYAYGAAVADEIHGLITDTLTLKNAADDALGDIKALNVCRAWAFVQWNSGSSSWDVAPAQGITGATKNATGSFSLTLADPPPDGTGGVVQVFPYTSSSWPRHGQGLVDTSTSPCELLIQVYDDDGAGGVTAADFGAWQVSAFWKPE